MEILSLLLFSLAAASAQSPPRGPGFRNPGFRNVRTPMATSASRDRPFISIPIVLLPDGQQVPKPKQTTYHYVGHAVRNGQQQRPNGNNRSPKQQGGPAVGKAAVNYQVSVPPPAQPPQQKRGAKPPRVSVSQLNNHLRVAYSNPQRNRGNAQQLQQQQQQQKANQQLQSARQQRGSFNQNHQRPSQQAVMAHRQNVANFVNFATALGASAAAQQNHRPVALPPGVAFHGQNQNAKPHQEVYAAPKPLIENHRQNGGVAYQHQVPSLAHTQVQSAVQVQQSPSGQNSAYSSHQHAQQAFNPQQQPVASSYSQHQQPSSQHQQPSSQPQQQQRQVAQQQQASEGPQSHQQAQNHQVQQQISIQNHHQQLSNAQSQQQALAQQYGQASASHQQSLPSSGSYAPATNLRAHNQNSGSAPSQAYQGNSAPQQSHASSLRSQASPQQNNVVYLANYDGQQVQTSQQSYAPTQSQQGVAAYDEQPKPASQQAQDHAGESPSANDAQQQNSYVAQSQESYPPAHMAFNGNIHPSGGYPLDHIAELNSFALQSAHEGQAANPLSYFQYQTSQELPFSLETLLGQSQASYLSQTAAEQEHSALDQTYGAMPGSQDLYVSAGQPVFASAQDTSASTSSVSDVGLQSYESYQDPQAGYASSPASQLDPSGYLTSAGPDKNYLNAQYSYLQSAQESSPVSTSNDGQTSQTSSAGTGGPLIYASSTSKQINYSPASTSSSSTSPGVQQYSASGYQSTSGSSPSHQGVQQYSASSYQSPASPTYVSFTTASASGFKSDSAPASGVVTPGSTYAKLNAAGAGKQQAESASDGTGATEDSEYDEEEGDEEEASYKVVYIPLDILKNILSNSVESQ